MPSARRLEAEAATPQSGAVSLHGRAAEDLRFIRHAMERSSTFTAVPGLGGMLMGVTGLAGAAVAARQPTADRWLATWLVAAAVAFVVGAIMMRRKAERGGVPLAGVTGRRFALSLSAPLAAGAALTAGLWQNGTWQLMPSLWLLLYGVGGLTGGAFSVTAVRVMGLCFMALGVLAMLTPPAWGDVWLALGFGVLQILFGAYIANRHGG
jgi:hypothetical protein